MIKINNKLQQQPKTRGWEFGTEPYPAFWFAYNDSNKIYVSPTSSVKEKIGVDKIMDNLDKLGLILTENGRQLVNVADDSSVYEFLCVELPEGHAITDVQVDAGIGLYLYRVDRARNVFAAIVQYGADKDFIRLFINCGNSSQIRMINNKHDFCKDIDKAYKFRRIELTLADTKKMQERLKVLISTQAAVPGVNYDETYTTETFSADKIKPNSNIYIDGDVTVGAIQPYIRPLITDSDSTVKVYFLGEKVVKVK